MYLAIHLPEKKVKKKVFFLCPNLDYLGHILFGDHHVENLGIIARNSRIDNSIIFLTGNSGMTLILCTDYSVDITIFLFFPPMRAYYYCAYYCAYY